MLHVEKISDSQPIVRRMFNNFNNRADNYFNNKPILHKKPFKKHIVAKRSAFPFITIAPRRGKSFSWLGIENEKNS
jgi:hypothetical protein